ncbi:MAG: hypothetical protein KGJ86_10050 [Chloroflexota bacterium]|nr:hypothetical protein [Chloroflexota bacterium]
MPGPFKSGKVDALELFARQEDDEAELLRRLQDALASIADPGIRFLLRQILTDEERHHQLVSAVVHGEPQPELPYQERITPLTASDDGQLLDAVSTLLELEREGLAKLEVIRRESRSKPSDPVELLLIVLIADSRKHVELLEYIVRRVEDNTCSLQEWQVLAEQIERYGRPRTDSSKGDPSTWLLPL